ncbi:MAG: phosphoglycerate kinase [Candidatus Microthrix sp.]|nr:phosphoglycerate kinase [Candidatus Microthrix sp.]
MLEASNAFWNGPMGVFRRWPPFEPGTAGAAHALAECQGLHRHGRRRLGERRSTTPVWRIKSTHVSTGGGAPLGN